MKNWDQQRKTFFTIVKGMIIEKYILCSSLKMGLEIKCLISEYPSESDERERAVYTFTKKVLLNELFVLCTLTW